jgi:hypothetical protein
MAEQQTHDYHPIVQATAAWELFSAARIAEATEYANVRASREKQRRDHSAAADAAWTPPAGG